MARVSQAGSPRPGSLGSGTTGWPSLRRPRPRLFLGWLWGPSDGQSGLLGAQLLLPACGTAARTPAPCSTLFILPPRWRLSAPVRAPTPTLHVAVWGEPETQC